MTIVRQFALENTILLEKYLYFFSRNKQKIKKIETIRRYHYNLTIIDEIYLIKNIDAEFFNYREFLRKNRLNRKI